MMNKQAVIEKVKEMAVEAKAIAKEEAAFTFKGAVIGISAVYAIKAASVAYSKTKEFINEQL